MCLWGGHCAVCQAIWQHLMPFFSPRISAAVLHSLTEPARSLYCPMSEYNGSENESVSSIPGWHEAEIRISDDTTISTVFWMSTFPDHCFFLQLSIASPWFIGRGVVSVTSSLLQPRHLRPGRPSFVGDACKNSAGTKRLLEHCLRNVLTRNDRSLVIIVGDCRSYSIRNHQKSSFKL